MENYTIILYSHTIFATHLLISMGCEALQKKKKKINQYYQVINKTFKKKTIIAHAHHAKITHKCTKDKQYPVTHIPHWASPSFSPK